MYHVLVASVNNVATMHHEHVPCFVPPLYVLQASGRNVAILYHAFAVTVPFPMVIYLILQPQELKLIKGIKFDTAAKECW